MIRDMVPEDKEQILRLGESFYKERLEQQGVHFSYAHASIHFDQFIKTPGILALCLVEGERIVGVAVGIASAIIFAKELAMQEMVWYVEPESRRNGLKLLKEFERRARALKLHFVTMVGLTGDPVLGIYPRLGYTETQRFFMKGLQ